MAIDYKQAGVDVEAGYKAVELMKKHTKSTYNNRVLGDLGSFGGFFNIAGLGGKEPVMVAGTDGVGTKLKYAFILDKHGTIGIDCVAMCVNDIVCQGASPLIFLDYYAVGKLNPEIVATVVGGVAEGCRQSSCALIGGETAEMPGFYPDGEYDLAGFSVGVVDKSRIINGSDIKVGDKLVGLASSGLHSNGFSLVRKIFGEDKEKLSVYNESLGCTVGEALLTPTRIYVKNALKLADEFVIKGIAHITGGGFFENIPRIFPEGVGARVNLASYPLSPLFELVKEQSGLDNSKLYNTFNMGIGMVMAVDSADADKLVARANALGEQAYIIGECVAGKGVILE